VLIAQPLELAGVDADEIIFGHCRNIHINIAAVQNYRQRP
jgi:hypothetical protein